MRDVIGVVLIIAVILMMYIAHRIHRTFFRQLEDGILEYLKKIKKEGE